MNILSSIKKVLVIFFIFFFSACGNNNSKQESNNKANENTSVSGDLIIFHAGSLSIPFKEIAEAFNKRYQDINIILEPSGSRKCARKIIDLKRPCDIMASADYKVIDNLLIPDYADWDIKFTSNEMVIAYNSKSRYFNKINKSNWYDILLKDDVIFGRSDPDSDPCGYRAVLTIKLAEKYYHKQGIANKFLKKDLNYMRPKGSDLLALLESNTVDYIFEYRSVAEQHKLKYLILPDEINLKNPEYKKLYSTVTVNISGKKPGEMITRKGEPMIYGITELKNAPHKKAADVFLEFLLNKNKGMSILERNGQASVIPSPSDTYNNIPDKFKKFSTK